jgi:hypothetical protein
MRNVNRRFDDKSLDERERREYAAAVAGARRLVAIVILFWLCVYLWLEWLIK